MVDNRKTGAGLLTYARPETFAKLFESVVTNPSIDYVVVVKNKSVDYGDRSPQKLVSKFGCESRVACVDIPEDVGIGCCKNVALMRMVQAGCSHLFTVEDDMEIKSQEAFEQYARTAVAFGLNHLNFGACWDDAAGQEYKPAYSLAKPGVKQKLDVYNRLCGAFSYYSSIAIWQAGLIDSKRFVNALDHVEHAYRLSIMGMASPYNAFADAHGSRRWLSYSEAGRQTTLPDPRGQERISFAVAAAKSFERRYGFKISQTKIPSPEQVAAELGVELVRE